MTNPIETTAITNAASQDGDLENARLEWSQPTLLRNGIERATRGGAWIYNVEGGFNYVPS